MLRRLLSVALVGGLFGLFAFPANAATIPDASFSNSGTYTDCPISSPCTFSQSASAPTSFALGPCSVPIANCDGVSLVSTDTSAFSSTVSGLSTQGSGTVTSNVTEYYEVVGPGSPTSVPLLLSALFTASASGADAIGLAEVTGLPPNSLGGTIGACVGVGTACGGGNVPRLQLFNLALSGTSNTGGSLQFIAQGSANSGSFTASFDPQLQIDPSWLNTHPGFSLELSPDLVTPLPAAVWLLLGGLGGLGLLVRKPRLAAS